MFLDPKTHFINTMLMNVLGKNNFTGGFYIDDPILEPQIMIIKDRKR
jgi:hypothetical protein